MRLIDSLRRSDIQEISKRLGQRSNIFKAGQINMASIQASALKLILRIRVKRELDSKAALVRHLRSAMDTRLFPSPLPSGIRIRKAQVADVPGEWLEVANPRMTMLYLHGGAFIGGKLDTYHTFCGELAKRLQARIFLADYRLAPEHPYPAATDDCFRVYRQMSSELNGKQPFVLAGDSAGGNLTLVTLLRARDNNLPMPACALTLSPGADATGTLMSLAANSDGDAMLSKAMINMAVDVYLAGADPTHAYVSPGRAEYSGFPPLMVTVSEQECLRDDAYCVAHQARMAGVPVELLSRPDMPHVWPIFHLFLPEAKRDMHSFVRFIAKHAGEGRGDATPDILVQQVSPYRATEVVA